MDLKLDGLLVRIHDAIEQVNILKPDPTVHDASTLLVINRRNALCAGVMQTALDDLQMVWHSLSYRLLLDKIVAWSGKAGAVLHDTERQRLGYWERRGIADGYELMTKTVVEHLTSLHVAPVEIANGCPDIAVSE